MRESWRYSRSRLRPRAPSGFEQAACLSAGLNPMARATVNGQSSGAVGALATRACDPVSTQRGAVRKRPARQSGSRGSFGSAPVTRTCTVPVERRPHPCSISAIRVLDDPPATRNGGVRPRASEFHGERHHLTATIDDVSVPNIKNRYFRGIGRYSRSSSPRTSLWPARLGGHPNRPLMDG